VERLASFQATANKCAPQCGGFCALGVSVGALFPERIVCYLHRMDALLREIAKGAVCAAHLPPGPPAVLAASAGGALLETVRGFRDHLPRSLPQPHPSLRSRTRLRRNPWFEAEVIPELCQRVARILRGSGRTARTTDS
jgi:hypothetical protein